MFRSLPTLLSLAALEALVACAAAPTIGAAPDSVPPRLTMTDRTDPATGRALLDWDRPGAFGVVSGDLKAVGDGACMAARPDLEALGYHPGARDEKGEPLAGGGFYCHPKANGDRPDPVAPRLVATAKADANGRKVLAWDRPGAFGKVPEAKRVAGDAACMTASVDLEAIAYHPLAQDAEGNMLPGGGFYCYRKKTGERPGEMAPRLVRADGSLGWDRPAAFGAVPAERQAVGDKVCAGGSAGMRAIGYHPAALDEAGKPIQGGGFFCADKPGAAGGKVMAKG